MDVSSYQEGDLIRIRDIQAANATISISENIEKGLVVRIEHIMDGHMICKRAERSEEELVKPFPPNAGPPNADEERRLSTRRDNEVVADVADYLSDEEDSTLDSLK